MKIAYILQRLKFIRIRSYLKIVTLSINNVCDDQCFACKPVNGTHFKNIDILEVVTILKISIRSIFDF
jgi:hypothetical protein